MCTESRGASRTFNLELGAQGRVALGLARAQLVQHLLECARPFHAVPLRVLHAKLPQSFDDPDVLGILCDRTDTKILGEIHDRADHGDRLGVLENVGNEAAVDLDVIDGQGREIFQGIGPRAKIIERETAAHGPQVAHERQGLGEIQHRNGLGDLKGDQRGSDSRAANQSLDALEKGRVR